MFREKEADADSFGETFRVRISDERLTALEFKNICSSIQNPNDLLIVKMLYKYGPKIRSKLVSLTGIPRSTVFDGLERLRILGFIDKRIILNGRTGRPFVSYFLI